MSPPVTSLEPLGDGSFRVERRLDDAESLDSPRGWLLLGELDTASDRIAGSQWYTTQAPTQTNRDTFKWAGEAYDAELERLRKLFDDLRALEERMEAAGAPWTPGRLP